MCARLCPGPFLGHDMPSLAVAAQVRPGLARAADALTHPSDSEAELRRAGQRRDRDALIPSGTRAGTELFAEPQSTQGHHRPRASTTTTLLGER